MSHWDRKLAGEIVHLVRGISIQVTDAKRLSQLRDIDQRALDAERTVSTGPQTIALLLDELCAVCHGDGRPICGGRCGQTMGGLHRPCGIPG